MRDRVAEESEHEPVRPPEGRLRAHVELPRRGWSPSQAAVDHGRSHLAGAHPGQLPLLPHSDERELAALGRALHAEGRQCQRLSGVLARHGHLAHVPGHAGPVERPLDLPRRGGPGEMTGRDDSRPTVAAALLEQLRVPLQLQVDVLEPRGEHRPERLLPGEAPEPGPPALLGRPERGDGRPVDGLPDIRERPRVQPLERQVVEPYLHDVSALPEGLL